MRKNDAKSEVELSRLLQEKAEWLKEDLWSFMDQFGEHRGVKSSMNELLDLIDELVPRGEE